MKKKITVFLICSIFAAFLVRSPIRDSLTLTGTSSDYFGSVKIEKITWEENEGKSHLRIFCMTESKLPISGFECISDSTTGLSPLPGGGFVIHMLDEDSPYFLEKITIPVRSKTSNETLFELTTRFWPKDVNQAG